MVANEDDLDTFSTSLTSSRPRLWQKRYSSPRNLLVNTPHFPTLLRRRQIMRRKPCRRRQWADVTATYMCRLGARRLHGCDLGCMLGEHAVTVLGAAADDTIPRCCPVHPLVGISHGIEITPGSLDGSGPWSLGVSGGNRAVISRRSRDGPSR